MCGDRPVDRMLFGESVYYVPRPAKVREATRMTEGEVLIRLKPADLQPVRFHPGQFVQVSVFGVGEVPISICSRPSGEDGLELCVRAAGGVTSALHRMGEGGWVGVRGPYGRGFPVEEMKGRDLLVIAAGLGMAPLRSLVAHIREHRGEYGRLIVVYGTRTRKDILFQRDLKDWEQDGSMETILTLSRAGDDWQGRRGRPTEPLRDLDIRPGRTVAAMAGPPALYRYAAMELFDKGVAEEDIFCALERHFECGIGKCGHCQLNGVYVCQNGPVFRFGDLTGLTEAIEAWAPDEEENH